ncbi:MAG: HNH endonuclease signature motif containing protein [Pelodictyon phaeoclathratiforme]
MDDTSTYKWIKGPDGDYIKNPARFPIKKIKEKERKKQSRSTPEPIQKPVPEPIPEPPPVEDTSMYKWIIGDDGFYHKNKKYLGDSPISPFAKISSYYNTRSRKKSNRSGTSHIPGWAKIRASVLERDRYLCRLCGRDGGEEELNIHHIDRNRKHNDLSNLVTLCGNCHRAVHVNYYIPDGLATPIWGIISLQGGQI